MPPLKSLLIPHSSLSDHGDSLNIIVKLNNDVIHTLKNTLLQHDDHDASMKPKLIVKNGDYYLKLNQDLIATKRFKETSRIDLYSNGDDVCLNLGKIDMRLNLLYNDKSRLKRIQSIERPRSEVNNTGSHHLPLNSKSVPNSPHMTLTDFTEDNALIKLRKLIHLLSLGPITVRELNSIIKIDTVLITKYGTLYVEGKDSLKYPHYSSDSNNSKYVLKDIYYKDLSLFFYTEAEKPMILQNFNLQMTKMGYQGQSLLILSINHEYDEIIKKLQTTRERKLNEKLEKLDELKRQENELKRKEEELKKKEEEKKKRDEKREGEDLKKINTNDKQTIKKDIKKRITPPPPQPPPNTLKTRELKKKRTISESSNSSVNSMKSPGEDVESPISSQEEIDDDISLNEIKRQKVVKLSITQLDLFKKFKAKYQIYLNLYQLLSTTKSRSRSDFQKLTILENEVKTLKKKIYNLER